MNSIKPATNSGFNIFDKFNSPEREILRRAVATVKYAETHDSIDAMQPASRYLSDDFAERNGLMPAVDACIQSFLLQGRANSKVSKK